MASVKCIFTIFITVYVNIVLWTIADAKCSDVTKGLSTDKEYLTKVLETMSNKSYTTSDGRFVLSVCEKAQGVSNAKAGLVDTKNKTAPVIGLYDDIFAEAVTTSTDATPVIYFRYNNGDNCKNNEKRSATVVAVCERQRKESEFKRISRNEDDCSYTFILTTSSFCDVKHSAPSAPPETQSVSTAQDKSSSHMSPLGGFLLFLLVLAVGYCVVGFLYKRYVLGARGAQQVPNYLFWIRVTHAIQDCVANRPSPRYSSGSSRAADYDRANAADVQLMNDDEFKYDQPASAGTGDDGRSSTFRQQQLNVASSPNTPNLNAQRQQPLLVPQEDADDRLLQV